MRIQVFIAGTVAAAAIAGVAGGVGGLGFWGIVGLVVSVLVAAQLLYLALIAFLAAGNSRKALPDEAHQNGSRRQKDAPPPSGELSDN